MDDKQKAQLQTMMRENDVKDNTEGIKSRKDSIQIREDIEFVMKTKSENPGKTSEEIDELCNGKCFYLFINYTNVYNMLIKNDLDPRIMNQLLKQLENIESGKLDQQEASFEVGKLLKQIYIDTQLQEQKTKEAAAEEKDRVERETRDKDVKEISWAQYKQKHLSK